jgi:MoaA/NifB/PqqE/SkfB family radical SAM enzyme
MSHPVMTPARTANQRQNIEEFDQRRTRLSSRPLALFVELTQNCNLRCASCRSATTFRADWNMTDALFERVADELFSTALLVDLRGWGESTILKGFPRAADRVLDSGARLRLVTNGQVNLPRVWDRMMATGSLLVLSCDAATPGLFSTLRTGGTLQRLTATAREAVALRERHGAREDLISLYVVVSRPNLGELAGIVELAASLGVRRVSLGPIQIGRDHPWNLRHDLDGVRQALDAAAERARLLDVQLHLASAMDVTLALDDGLTSLCTHPWAYAYISHGGGVGFCDHLIGMEKYTFGLLRDLTFEEIWNGEGFQNLRERHVGQALGERFSACRWCYRQRYVDFEHLTHPALAQHVVSTATRTRLWADGGTGCAATSFLGADQAETPHSHQLIPLTVTPSRREQ